MVVDYALGQIPKEESFDRIRDGIEFIKKQFPIEND